ncbi:MAG: glycoside hydrolase family 38 C-terminal domain-containing protein, partial [Cyanobacteria bacterium P01_D01_bin.73]
QFHDILPGSAVSEAYVDADKDWQFAKDTAQTVLNRTMARWTKAIVDSKPGDDAIPYLIFNSVDGDRSDIVEVPISEDWTGENWQAIAHDGKALKSQIVDSCSMEEGNNEGRSLLVSLDTVDSIGYQTIYLKPIEKDDDISTENHRYKLANQFIEATIDSDSGLVTELIDLATGENCLKSSSNQLQFFKDEGQYWDAWNIDPDYEKYSLSAPQLIDIKWLETGPVRQRIRTTFKWQNSTFWQDYILDSNSPYLTVTTQVDWRDRHVLVKAAVFLDESYDQATYQIPCGAIARPTRPKTDAEKAKWEVPALQWADLSAADNTVGLSILNDCKHGYDAKPGQLRLTLLRGATWPNPNADKGYHCFTYALYPHARSWQKAGTVHHADCLNRPLRAVAIAPDSSTPKTQPAAAQLLTLGQSNLRLMTLKRSEDSAKNWVVHCHESHGEVASLENAEILGQPLVGNNCVETDLLEKSAIAVSEVITPWTVTALKFSNDAD